MLTFYASYDIISIKGAILLLFEFTGHVFANIIHEYSDRLSVTEIGYCRGKNADSTLNLLRENHFLHIVLDGTVEYDGRRLGRGGVAYLKPMIAHDVIYPEGSEGEHCWLSFGGTESDSLLDGTGLAGDQFNHIDDGIVDIMSGIFKEAVFGAGMSEKRLAVKFEGILRYVVSFISDRNLPEAQSGMSRSAEYAERASEFIRYNFQNGIRPSDVAGYIGVTEKYLCRLFRTQYQMTPERYLSTCRYDKARRLLRTTSLDIKRISALCGFDDPTYFARWFRRVNGSSATDYRVYLEENSKRVSDGKDKRDEGE